MWFPSSGRADQPLTAVIRCYGQTEQEGSRPSPPSACPSAPAPDIPAVCGDFGGQVLHRWRRDTIHRAALVAVKSAPRYPRWLLFPVHAARQ
ncbi:hypothetical protein EH61_00400 [Escherichia coli]|nr:hypothetical protein EH61_00400 [Escherichia coli]